MKTTFDTGLRWTAEIILDGVIAGISQFRVHPAHLEIIIIFLLMHTTYIYTDRTCAAPRVDHHEDCMRV